VSLGLTGIADVFGPALGIVLGLLGAALVVLGTIAASERAYRSGLTTALVGAGFVVLAMWLVGAF
jgi:hypothetical protein